MEKNKVNNNKVNNKIRFENEEEGPIQIVLNKKEEIMEEKPLVEESKGESVTEEESKVKEEDTEPNLNTTPPTTTHNTTTHNTTIPPTPTTEEITPLEKVTAFVTALVKAITDGLIKAFVWITEIFKRRRRENEERGVEEREEEIREENV
jgi:hypothetical protein